VKDPTVIFILALVVAVIVFDVFIITKKGKQSSISAYIIKATKKYASVGLILGYVLGHLTWSMSDFDWMPDDLIKSKCEAKLDDLREK
jgi:uncharacterized metal-binding protein